MSTIYNSAKCENCGASFKPFNQYCEYCGSERPRKYKDFEYTEWMSHVTTVTGVDIRNGERYFQGNN